jgi:GntR family transcriptional regulator
VLDPSLPIPLYRQLASALEAQIRQGTYPVGHPIPSEHVLSKAHGLGRPTVRQATDWLVRAGLLERRRGSGTFVTTEPNPVDLFTLTGTAAAFAGAGLVLSTALLSKVSRVPASDARSDRLEDVDAYCLSRLGSIDDTPVLLERLWFEQKQFPRLDKLPLGSGPISELVAAHYHFRPSGGQQLLSVVELEPADAKALMLPKGARVLLLQRTLDFPGAPRAITVDMFCRTDRFALVQNLTADGLRTSTTTRTDHPS